MSDGRYPVDPSLEIILRSNITNGDPRQPAAAWCFRLPKVVAAQASTLLASLLESDESCSASANGTLIDVPVDTDGWTLGRCVAYFMHHHDNQAVEIDKPMTKPLPEYLSDWDNQFVFHELIAGGDETRHDGLVACLQAARFLNAKRLVELCGAGLASIMRGKSTAELQRLFGTLNAADDSARAGNATSTSPSVSGAHPTQVAAMQAAFESGNSDSSAS